MEILSVIFIVLVLPSANADVCPAVCAPNPCQNGGTCRDVGGGCYTCTCTDPYVGDNCEIAQPCYPGCENGGTCNGEDCDCPSDYTGEHCESDWCVPECENGGTCSGGDCDCPPEFTGPRCETPNWCVPECENGGTCSGGNCDCPPEFTGPGCETPIDSCSPDCENGGTCNDGVCNCPSGYTGERCETSLCDCVHGYCDDGVCMCPPTYTGERCESDITPGEGWNCDDNNPCTQWNIYNNYFRFPYDDNCTQYILCVEGPPHQCHIMPCALPTIWNPYLDTCTEPTPEWPCYTQLTALAPQPKRKPQANGKRRQGKRRMHSH